MRRQEEKLWVALVLFIAIGTAIPAESKAQEISVRDLVRKHLSAAKSETGQKKLHLTGLPTDVSNVVALEYTVLLRREGRDEAVDPKEYQFKIGDQIRVRIEPLNDLYIYIFHEGASGKHTSLLPEQGSQEKPVLVTRGKTVVLPNDDSVFEFVPPAGEEKLIVVATEKPVEDLDALTGAVFAQPGEQLNDEEQAARAKLRARVEARLQSIRRRQQKVVQTRGLLTPETLKKAGDKIARSADKRVQLEEPPHDGKKSTFFVSGTVGNSRQNDVLLTIPLVSVTGG